MENDTSAWPVYWYRGRNVPDQFWTWSREQQFAFTDQYDQLEQAKAERRRVRTDLRRAKRIDRALAGRWDRCCIPGCDGKTPRHIQQGFNNSAQTVPVCWDHAMLITKMVEPEWENRDVLAVRLIRATRAVDNAEAEAAQDDADYQRGWLDGGHLYFVRVGNMIKLGWSSKLRARLKQYGASAEVLCHWPGTRADETALHRQLRPQLARGREWYHDNDVLAGVIGDYIKRHGEPTVLPEWTQPRPDMVAKKRYAA